MYNVRYFFSANKKHQPCILLFWTLFDTYTYCYRYVSLYVSSFISLVFWKSDIVLGPSFWINNTLFTYNFLEKFGKWKLGVHYEPCEGLSTRCKVCEMQLLVWEFFVLKRFLWMLFLELFPCAKLCISYFDIVKMSRTLQKL